jgi:hypothetical protein
MIQINYLDIHRDFLSALPLEALESIKQKIQAEWRLYYNCRKETPNKNDIFRIEQKAVYNHLKYKVLFCKKKLALSSDSIRIRDFFRIQEFPLREEISKNYLEFIENDQLFFDLVKKRYKILLEDPEHFFTHEWQIQQYFIIKMRNLRIPIEMEVVKYNSQKKKRVIDLYIPSHNLGIELKRGCKPKYSERHENQRLLYEDWFQCQVLLIYAFQCNAFFSIIVSSELNSETIKYLRTLF